jgi:geranylgeranyl diphosphate synthase type I
MKTPTLSKTFSRYQNDILAAMHKAVESASHNPLPTQAADLSPFYGQMQYHLGWVDQAFSPESSHPGKLIRPTLLLLAYEAAGSWGLSDQSAEICLRRALPAAAAVELTHNFTLIHDDIVDGDIERRHRSTLWTIWGSSQGINTGDGLFALSRLALWDCLQFGVEGDIAARLGALLDHTTLIVAEGQYLDLSFEQRQDISVALYLDMIARKTAVLMSCAAEMGACLGTRDVETITSLRDFGLAVGIAFQVRDDVLGVWASTAESGKTAAGDIYRRKKSLPFLHALEYADPSDRQTLRRLYAQEQPLTEQQVNSVLALYERTNTRAYCLDFLRQQCVSARKALNAVPRLRDAAATRALTDLQELVDFIKAEIQG